mmetsp:Transcript_17813/g.29490  ORF Transcript_17813/g.29490 Transcript_17813/m.29490 type:complete len:137 (+) Transcript_17813:2-412(+)
MCMCVNVCMYVYVYVCDRRLMSVIDPMIPTSFMLQCLRSYVPSHIHPLSSCYISPAIAPDHLLRQLPPTYVMCGSLDPLLDDSVYFVRRLRAVGKAVEFKVYSGFPHGFLNMGFVVPSTRAAIMQVSTWLKALMIS